jgi:arylformamidase
MKYYDVSMPIHENMQVYKNKLEKKPSISYIQQTEPHFTSETVLTMNLHSGTHLDFPLHMIEHGLDSSNFNPVIFCRPVKVFDLTHIQDVISKEDIEQLDIQQNDIVFFKTRNSWIETFDFDFVYLDQSGASYLASKHILAVGMDGLGIERLDPMHQTHHILMKQNIWIIEGLRLKEVQEKTYQCIALPIPVLASDALPLRVILHD